jgi:hypothetical protein
MSSRTYLRILFLCRYLRTLFLCTYFCGCPGLSELSRTDGVAHMKKYLRKADVAVRYGNINKRSVDRHVERKVLPPPEYPLENDIPMWDEEKLDEHDRAAALAVRPKREQPETADITTDKEQSI